jgi:IPT/TIG domain-containing protein
VRSVSQRIGAFGVVAAIALGVAASVSTLSSRASDDPVIAAAGDIACDPIDSPYNDGQGTTKACRQLFTSNLLVGAGLSGVLPLGDDQYECAGLAAFDQVYDVTWGRLKSITHPVPGNHEYQTTGGTGCDASGTASGYFAYFGAAAGDATRGYYSYDIGSWHLIALNSNCPQVGGCGAGSQEELWLRADLAAHANFCTLAYWHYPRFSSSGDIQGSSVFWDDLYAAGADVVLSGHKHNYERFAPQSPQAVADPSFGIREFVVGTGGKDHQGFNTPDPNSEVRDSSSFGVLDLTLHPTSYDWQFVPVAGQSFSDNGSASCHAAPTGAITSISPTTAAAGATVTITGSGLSSTTSVDFAGHSGVTPTSVTATSVKVTVPGDAGTGALTVHGSGPDLTTPAFTPIPTSITSFKPTSAADGATVTLTGVGFGAASSTRKISVGAVAATSITYVSATSVKFVVPQGAPTSGAIHLTVDGGPDVVSAKNLAVTATLASFSPSGGAAGVSVDIVGSGFSGVTDVMFGSTSVGGIGHFTLVSATKIDVTLPSGATDGTLTVVRSSGGNLSSAATFRVLAVTSLSSSSLHPGDTLTINGTNLGNATGVDFPGHSGSVTPTSTTSSSLAVVVPADATSGALTVRTADLGNVDTPAVTIVPLPVIVGIAVTNTPSGSTLHISGSHFVNVTAVRIGNDDVTSSSTVDSPSSITVAIPAGESTGVVTVTADGATSTGNPTLYAHSNGVGQAYYNAEPPNTYDLANATDAAAVFAAGTTSPTTCGSQAALQLVTATEAVVWVYDPGILQGHVYLNTTAATPVCPTATDPTWG